MSAEPLVNVIRTCGEDWLLDWFPGGEAEAIAHLRGMLDKASRRYKERYAQRNRITPISESALFDEAKANRHRATAFLQALGETSNPELLVMVWRILHGDTIKRVELMHLHGQSFRFRAVLESDDGLTQDYESSDIEDAALLRHLGVLKIDNQPVFDGFYPLTR